MEMLLKEEKKNKEFADVIAEIKYKYRLTQTEIAERLGISRQYLSDTLNGRYPFSNELKEKISKVFFVDEIFEDKITTINEQLLYTRKRLKMTQVVVAVMFGVTRQTIERWESGKKIPAAKLPIVQKFIEDNNSNNSSKNNSNMEEETRKGQYMLFDTRPRLPMAATLGNIKDYLRGEHRDECDEKPVVRQFSHYDFTMLVNSNSMAPYIDTGDVIACAEIGETIDYGHVYVVDTDGGALIKRVYQAKSSSQLKLASGNDTYQDFLIDKSKIRGLYRVVGLLRVGI